MARAVVLGATGHIGAHIVRALLAEGHEVRAAYRREQFLSVLEDLPIERVPVDLETGAGLPEALEGRQWVFHAAASYPSFRARREGALDAGLASTRRTLELIRRANPVRVVFTSSASTVERGIRQPASEPRGWRSLYAAVKTAIEREVQRAGQEGLPVTMVNPSVCLGEYDAHRFSGRAILLFATYRLPVYLDYRFDAIYTGDVGIGHVRAAERGRLGERYVLTTRQVSLKELWTRVGAAVGCAPPRWRVPYRLALAAALGTELAAWITGGEPLLPREAVPAPHPTAPLDGAPARRELALPQTPVDEAIRRALAWFKANGLL